VLFDDEGGSMKLVVVGNGPVGHHLVARFTERDRDRRWQVTVLAEESRPAYDRTRLSSYFREVARAQLALADVPNAALQLSRPAELIDRERRVAITRDGEYSYDALVLATGAYPYVPSIPGAGLAGCFTYRTWDDLADIEAYATGRQRAVVLGGGLLGLEAADALRGLGLRTRVVEQADQLLPGYLDRPTAALLRQRLTLLGVATHLGRQPTGLRADPAGAVCEVVLDGDTGLPADLVVFACGVRPRDDLARQAGLPVGTDGGVLVDDACRTADRAIWAVGDCAEVAGRRYGLLPPGLAMAEVAVDQLLGGDARFTGSDAEPRLRLAGIDPVPLRDLVASPVPDAVL
jgi:nitrite reductase (NADH) large subunit